MPPTATRSAAPPPPAPGLGATTAWFRMPVGPKLQALAVLVGGLLLFATVKGGWPPDPWVLGIIAVGALWWGLKVLRSEVSAGPGWLATQGLFRRHWVRTDALVRATETRSGVDRVVVLRDRDGRRLGVLMGMLTQEHEVRVQLSKDVRTSVDAGLVLTDRAAELLGARRRSR